MQLHIRLPWPARRGGTAPAPRSAPATPPTGPCCPWRGTPAGPAPPHPRRPCWGAGRRLPPGRGGGTGARTAARTDAAELALFVHPGRAKRRWKKNGSVDTFAVNMLAFGLSFGMETRSRSHGMSTTASGSHSLVQWLLSYFRSSTPHSLPKKTSQK